MNLVLLSGGSGKRLWPLSNDVRSKQFIPFLKTENGYESMVQRVYRQIKQQSDVSGILPRLDAAAGVGCCIFPYTSRLRLANEPLPP